MRFQKPRRESQRAHANLKAFLLANGIQFEFLEKKRTEHAIEAASVTGIPLEHFVKTLVFHDQDNNPFIAILRGDHDVDRHKLQNATGYASVKTAPVQIAEKITGYPVGGIPPIGHKTKLPTFIDENLLALKAVWCGGGSRSKLVRLRTEDILRLSNAVVRSFAREKKE
ncbi:YbaK/EbsC family protein [Candidatus Micrarchaeota archaeon]|nr:YbaK/EbsC family protein [Candidatus Micrarchaeota archaeon]